MLVVVAVVVASKHADILHPTTCSGVPSAVAFFLFFSDSSFVLS